MLFEGCREGSFRAFHIPQMLSLSKFTVKTIADTMDMDQWIQSDAYNELHVYARYIHRRTIFPSWMTDSFDIIDMDGQFKLYLYTFLHWRAETLANTLKISIAIQQFGKNILY